MKASLRTLSRNKYPIEVTSVHPAAALIDWMVYFRQKGIDFRLKLAGYRGKEPLFVLFRSITEQEIKEIKAGKIILRDGSLCLTEKARACL